MSEVETVVTGEAEVAAASVPEVTDTVKTEEARFTQADIDRIVKERLDREKANAAKQADKAAEAARAKALEEQGKYKELAEAAQGKVGELEPYKERAERLEAVLSKRWDAEKPGVPDYILPLLEKMPVDERLDYVTENREKWGGKSGPPNINAGAGTERRGGRTEQEKAELAALYGVKPQFIGDD
jgi:hypothetical protein